MKTLAVLLAGCLPLAVLTGMSFLGATSDNAVGSGLSDISLDAIEQQAAQESQLVQSQQRLVEHLTEFEPLSTTELPDPGNLDASFAGLTNATIHSATEKAKQGHSGVLDVARTLQQVRDDGSDLTTLQALRTSDPLKNVAGSADLRNYLDQRIDQQLSARSFTQALDRAREEIDKHNYPAALTILNRLTEQDRTPAEIQRKQSLTREAKFWQHWYIAWKPQARVPTTVTVYQQRLEELNRRLAAAQQSTAPVAVDPDEVAQVAWVKATVTFLQEELNYEKFVSDPPDDPSMFLTDLKTAYELRGERVSALQKLFREWVSRQLPEKSSSRLPNRTQEATLLDGSLRLGEFEKKGAIKIWYQFKPLAKTKADETSFNAPDFKRQPQEPADQQLLQAYRTPRAKLLTSPGRREPWLALQSELDQASKYLPEYRKQRAAIGYPIELDFQRELQLVNHILDHWNTIRLIFPEEATQE